MDDPLATQNVPAAPLPVPAPTQMPQNTMQIALVEAARTRQQAQCAYNEKNDPIRKSTTEHMKEQMTSATLPQLEMIHAFMATVLDVSTTRISFESANTETMVVHKHTLPLAHEAGTRKRRVTEDPTHLAKGTRSWITEPGEMYRTPTEVMINCQAQITDGFPMAGIPLHGRSFPYMNKLHPWNIFNCRVWEISDETLGQGDMALTDPDVCQLRIPGATLIQLIRLIPTLIALSLRCRHVIIFAGVHDLLAMNVPVDGNPTNDDKRTLREGTKTMMNMVYALLGSGEADQYRHLMINYTWVIPFMGKPDDPHGIQQQTMEPISNETNETNHHCR
jgi:hypothetical protein